MTNWPNCRPWNMQSAVLANPTCSTKVDLFIMIKCGKYSCYIIHLMCAPEGNSEFCFVDVSYANGFIQCCKGCRTLQYHPPYSPGPNMELATAQYAVKVFSRYFLFAFLKVDN